MKIQKYLEQSPVFAINAAYEKIIPQMNAELAEYDVNLLQGLVLTALFFEGDAEVTPSALAQLFATSRGNMSHILSHLEYKGWVRRVVHAKDARKFHIELKAEGRRRALSLIKFFDKTQTHFENELGLGACQKTVAGLQALLRLSQS